jgi:hypothetical protein
MKTKIREICDVHKYIRVIFKLIFLVSESGNYQFFESIARNITFS